MSTARLLQVSLALALLGLAQGIAGERAGLALAQAADGWPGRCVSPVLEGGARAPVEVPGDGRLKAGTLLCGWAVAYDGDTLGLAQAARGDGDFFAAPSRGPRRAIRIRLFGVSAAEMDAGGLTARTALDDLLTGDRNGAEMGVAGGPVACVATGGTTYKRPVAVCEDGRGRDLALALIEAGAAVTFRTYLDDRPDLAAAYITAEGAARAHGRGVWSAVPDSPAVAH